MYQLTETQTQEIDKAIEKEIPEFANYLDKIACAMLDDTTMFQDGEELEAAEAYVAKKLREFLIESKVHD